MKQTQRRGGEKSLTPNIDGESILREYIDDNPAILKQDRDYIASCITNAPKLAEALRGVLACYRAAVKKPFRIVALDSAAQDALAAWEKSETN